MVIEGKSGKFCSIEKFYNEVFLEYTREYAYKVLNREEEEVKQALSFFPPKESLDHYKALNMIQKYDKIIKKSKKKYVFTLGKNPGRDLNDCMMYFK